MSVYPIEAKSRCFAQEEEFSQLYRCLLVK